MSKGYFIVGKFLFKGIQLKTSWTDVCYSIKLTWYVDFYKIKTIENNFESLKIKAGLEAQFWKCLLFSPVLGSRLSFKKPSL